MPSNLKIYFCGSIRGGRNYVDIYGRLVEELGKYGKVLSPFVADKNMTEDSPHEGTPMTDKEIHDRDVGLLRECHVVVAEVTQPSLGVGYEVAQAKTMGKKILCLYQPQPGKLLSAMIRGAEEEGKFFIRNYNEDDVPKILEEFFTACFRRTHKDSLDWTTYEPM